MQAGMGIAHTAWGLPATSELADPVNSCNPPFMPEFFSVHTEWYQRLPYLEATPVLARNQLDPETKELSISPGQPGSTSIFRTS
jgi:hypothetical protein